jgi:integration host factor subunit beta
LLAALGTQRPKRTVSLQGMSDPTTPRLTRQDLIEQIAMVSEVSRKEAQYILDIILGSIVHALKAGDRVEIRGLGSFRTRQRGSRIGRNPRTGTRVEVPAMRVAYFKPSTELIARLNRSAGEEARAAETSPR